MLAIVTQFRQERGDLFGRELASCGIEQDYKTAGSSLSLIDPVKQRGFIGEVDGLNWQITRGTFYVFADEASCGRRFGTSTTGSNRAKVNGHRAWGLREEAAFFALAGPFFTLFFATVFLAVVFFTADLIAVFFAAFFDADFFAVFTADLRVAEI